MSVLDSAAMACYLCAFSRFDAIPECDKRTERQTDGLDAVWMRYSRSAAAWLLTMQMRHGSHIARAAVAFRGDFEGERIKDG